MVRVGFVCVYHYSNKIRPQGFDCLIKFIESLNKNCSYDFTIYIIDNQSEKVPNIVNTIDNIIYTRIDDQYISGLTGAWNLGIKQSYENKDDLIFALNDDLSFNHTINNFIKDILEHSENTDSIYGPTTNGIGKTYNWTRYMKKFGHTIDDLKKIIPNWISFYNNRGINPQYRDKIKDSNIIIETTNKYDINGYFIGFTKECYSSYCLDNGSFFSDKIEYAWGGQETELQDRLWDKGLKTFIVTSCWIDHIKLKKYQIGKQITDERYLK